MNIINSSAKPYIPQQTTNRPTVNIVENYIATQPTNKTSDSAKSTSNNANIASPLVSKSVQSTLLRLQETGSVFDFKDNNLMNVRGVSDIERQRFAKIIVEAAQTGGYNNPVEYIQSLPSDDIEVLRRVHSLAETSGVTNTDEEGAINLLLPKKDHVDINNDGLVKNGAATGFYFPPPNAPQSVKDAWEETTENMTTSDKMKAEMQFMMASIGANVKTDSDGKVIGIYEYNDPEYTNIFPTSEDGWGNFLEKLIAEYKEAIKLDSKLEKQLDMLNKFADNISSDNKLSV